MKPILNKVSACSAGAILLSVLFAVSLLTGCTTVDSQRIPNYRVNINLTPESSWQTYGVAAFGSSKRFIRELHEPSNFPWLAQTYTGYGGILLVCGIDAFTTEANVPLAYDLACPVECKQDIRVEMVPTEGFDVARCPICKSEYDVIQGAGRPVAGPALNDNYGLRLYQCVQPSTGIGGYLITN